MRGQQIHHVSGQVLLILSLTALLAVLSGYTQPPQPDEGTAAHIFQLSIAVANQAEVDSYLLALKADFERRMADGCG